MWITEISKYNSIKCGDIYIPTRLAVDFISKCVRPVVTEAIEPELLGFVGVCGSASLIQIHQQKLVCMTRHQLRLYDDFDTALESVRVVSFTDTKLDNIPFDRAIHCITKDEQEFEDVFCVAPYKHDENYSKDAPYYQKVRNLDGGDVAAHFIFVGYPITLDNFVLDETGIARAFNAVATVRDCYIDESYTPEVKHFNRYTFEKKLNGKIYLSMELVEVQSLV